MKAGISRSREGDPERLPPRLICRVGAWQLRGAGCAGPQGEGGRGTELQVHVHPVDGEVGGCGQHDTCGNEQARGLRDAG